MTHFKAICDTAEHDVWFEMVVTKDMPDAIWFAVGVPLAIGSLGKDTDLSVARLCAVAVTLDMKEDGRA